MNKLSSDNFRSLVDGLLRNCNYDLSQCSNSLEASRCVATIARRRAELLEAAPFRRNAELEALKGRALDRAAEVLLDYERRLEIAGKRPRTLVALSLVQSESGSP